MALKHESNLSPEESSRLIEMAWEDRTPMEAIAKSFGIQVSSIPKMMRKFLKRKTYIVWRKRVRHRKTKHEMLRVKSVVRHQSKMHNKYRR